MYWSDQVQDAAQVLPEVSCGFGGRAYIATHLCVPRWFVCFLFEGTLEAVMLFASEPKLRKAPSGGLGPSRALPLSFSGVHPCGTTCRQLSLLCHRVGFITYETSSRRV